MSLLDVMSPSGFLGKFLVETTALDILATTMTHITYSAFALPSTVTLFCAVD